MEAPAEQFLTDASPEAVSAWQQLGHHINKLDAIGLIAALFGPRSQFALIEEYALADNFRLHDRALFCPTVTSNQIPRSSTVPVCTGYRRGSASARCGCTLWSLRGIPALCRSGRSGSTQAE